MNDVLSPAVRYFTRDSRIMSALCIGWGDVNHLDCCLDGWLDQAETQPLQRDSLFDLASLTKLFTALLILRLSEEGVLSLADSAVQYAPQFTQLVGMTVGDVLTFRQGLRTPERVDGQPTPEAGLAQLFQAAPYEVGNGRAYSDMHTMVLKYVAEGAGKAPFFSLLQQKLLRPLGMNRTFAAIPPHLLQHTLHYDGEHRLERGVHTCRLGVDPGTPHDPKARLLSPHGEDLCGHAGLFSTLDDLARLCQGILRGYMLSAVSLQYLMTNRTGRLLPDGTHTQYLGAQVHLRHPVQYHSEVPPYMGNQAFGLSGFTGNHLSLDVERGIFVLFLGNRVLHRLTTFLPLPGESLAGLGLNPDGTGMATLPNGQQVYSSVDWVHQKDHRLHEPIRQEMGLPLVGYQAPAYH